MHEGLVDGDVFVDGEGRLEVERACGEGEPPGLVGSTLLRFNKLSLQHPIVAQELCPTYDVIV